MKTVSVVIPNYNGVALLAKNLPSVLKFCKGCEVIVVDDCSTDGSVKMLEEKFPSVQIIRHEKNHGFSTTVNDGFKRASGELILLLNTDVLLEEDVLERLHHPFSDPDVFGVGCLQKTILSDGKIIEEGNGEGYFSHGFFLHKKGNLSSSRTLWVFGGAGMFRKIIWENLGGLETLYEPFYWEDIDISYRALKSGYTILFDPLCWVIHTRDSSSIKSFYSPGFIRVISYRNQYVFVWLNISDIKFLVQHILIIPITLLRSIFSFQLFHFLGFLKALRILPDIFKKRRQYKKSWKISDREILKQFAQ